MKRIHLSRSLVSMAVGVSLFAGGFLLGIGSKDAARALAPMQGKYKRPNRSDKAMKQWRFGNISGKPNKAIARVKIREIDEGQPYTLRFTVINQTTAEQLDIELVDMIATHDPALDSLDDLDDGPSIFE